MLNKGLFLACTLALLSACDSSSVDKPAAPTVAASQPAKPVQDVKALAQRYAGRELSVVDVSEVQLDGASTLSVSFSVPLHPEQNFADKLHLVDAKTGILRSYQYRPEIAAINLSQAPAAKLWWDRAQGSLQPNFQQASAKFAGRATPFDLTDQAGRG